MKQNTRTPVRTLRAESAIADPIGAKAVELLRRQLSERCGANVVTAGAAEFVLRLRIAPDIGSEGFRIDDAPDGGVQITGNDPRGLIYGVGKFLRTSRYGASGNTTDGAATEDTAGGGGATRGFVPSPWRGVSVPAKPVRGIYFASHLHNFYHDAPVEKVTRYIEDLALWGFNTLIVWLDLHHFTGIDDPAARAMIARLRALLAAANGVGMSGGLGVLGNEAYASSPPELRADWTAGHDGYTRPPGGHYHVELCPNKPGARELLLRWQTERLDAFAGLDIDTLWIWPYDQGGCTCSQCRPWGANGFLSMAEPIARLYRQRWPHGKVVLSTWYFDRFTTGEWEGLTRAFADAAGETPTPPGGTPTPPGGTPTPPGGMAAAVGGHAAGGTPTPQASAGGTPTPPGALWADYILSDNFGDTFPEYPLRHGVPGGLPLVNFPEISMYYGQEFEPRCPWGGFGANPLPGRLQRLWDAAGAHLVGGFPYSEGIYEDLNKAICAQLYWQPDQPASQTVREYVAFEYSPDAVEELSDAIALMERSLPRVWHETGGVSHFVIKDPSGVDEAWRLVQAAERRLTPYVRGSWRWRLLYLRALIDHELLHNGFAVSDACEAAFEELTALYHAECAANIVAPPTRAAMAANRPE